MVLNVLMQLAGLLNIIEILCQKQSNLSAGKPISLGSSNT